MAINKNSIFLILAFVLLNSLQVFSQFSSRSGYMYGSDSEREGLFGYVKKITQKGVNKTVDFPNDRDMGEVASEYDCKGNLIKRVVSDGGSGQTYIYEPIGNQRRLKYSSVSSQGSRPPFLYRETWDDTENFMIAYASYDLNVGAYPNAKWDGFVLDERSFVGLEPIADLNPKAEMAWRKTWFYNKNYRLREFRSVKGNFPTRQIYTYDKDDNHPDTMTDERDYTTVAKTVYSYTLDSAKNWIKRDSTQTDFVHEKPYIQNSNDSRTIIYFDKGECKDS